MDNVATYSEARSEYTKQLATFIVPALVTWFQQLWHRNAHNRQQCLALFQTECEEVARWNQDRIHDEVRVLIERSGCDYMDLLVSAVFVAHTKVLTAVRLSQKQKQLSIDVPKLDHFIHRVFREAARSFWKAPFLFRDTGAVIENQKNLLQVEALAAEAITTAVRGLLPVKKILSDYIDGDAEEIEEENVIHHVPAAETKPAPEPEPEHVEVAVPVKQEQEQEEVVEKVVEAPAAGVTFSNYDTVFDDKKEQPELRFTPKEAELDDLDDFDDELDAVSSDTLNINEESTTSVADDDFEELEPKPKAAPVISETVGEDEMIPLE